MIIMTMIMGMAIPLTLGASLYDAAGMGIIVTIALPLSAFTVYSIGSMEVPYD